ncbi:hypothetical protein D3C86_2002760 [compost metagenome]
MGKAKGRELRCLVGKFGGEVWWRSLVEKSGGEVWWRSLMEKFDGEVWWREDEVRRLA